LLSRIFLDGDSFKIGGNGWRTRIDDTFFGVLAEVAHHFTRKLWLVLVRGNGEATEGTYGIVDVKTTSNDKPLADTNDVLVLFVFSISAKRGVIQFRVVAYAERDGHLANFSKILLELSEKFL